jgi:hypothetical protein
MFLDLRQVDIERATGISVARLSKAETGGLMLTRPEQVRLDNFLRDRMRIIAEIDNEARCSDSQRQTVVTDQIDANATEIRNLLSGHAIAV